MAGIRLRLTASAPLEGACVEDHEDPYHIHFTNSLACPSISWNRLGEALKQYGATLQRQCTPTSTTIDIDLVGAPGPVE